MRYAEVILDLSSGQLDRTFEYRIPEGLSVTVGDQVLIPFGPRTVGGFVVAVNDEVSWDVEKVKDILSLKEGKVGIDSEFIRLAAWLKETYGCTMRQALSTVLPVKTKRAPKEQRSIRSLVSSEELKEALRIAEKKKYHARVRLLEALIADEEIPYEYLTGKLNLTKTSIDPLVKAGLIEVRVMRTYRNPLMISARQKDAVTLNSAQNEICDAIIRRYQEGDQRPSLLFGITGSGKTEVYIELIRRMIEQGKQAIVLIPEISLTYQTVMRFYRYFGDRISILHSRMSDGERYDQYLRAQNGEIDVMIGPRSALFTPFSNLGIIIIDEEHDHAYRSDQAPRYHSDEVAIHRCRLAGGITVLGSATPSVESYRKSELGLYERYEMTERAVAGSILPQVSVVDLREELAAGNKSIFSRELTMRINEILASGKNGERRKQGMLFLNRRGFAGFVSCRQCGEVIKCPHCDVSLTAHNGRRLICHYCGYERPLPKTCPSCGSRYIAGFGTGTQKVEHMLHEEFPGIRVLRMDRDTTARKGEQEKILEAFAAGEADILVGTQMIVKGHDFPNVTLMGILAADLSLFESDFRSSEQTFDLLTQAAGRAGRGGMAGHVIIQTYKPEHYAITSAAAQDYRTFYEEEIAYRRMLCYPPENAMLSVLAMGGDERELHEAVDAMIGEAKSVIDLYGITIIGPTDAGISKIKDSYRVVFYAKHANRYALDSLRTSLEETLRGMRAQVRLAIYYD